jgi:hypothetical protein
MNYILAYATGYDKETYLPLLNSIKNIENRSNIKLILFTDLDSSAFNEYDFIEVVNTEDVNYKPIKYDVISAVLRYFYYLNYLKQLDNSKNIDSVSFIDVRDVVFQNLNLYNNIDQNKIYIFKENNRYTFGNEGCHKMWFDSIGRNDFSNKFKDDTFYCSGIHIFGNLDLTIYYLNLFTEQCEIYRDYKYAINDQPIHNILIYEKHLNEIELHRCESELDERIFSMGLCLEEDYIIENKKLYYKHNNVYPSIIHQYDRRLGRTKDLL